jgi:hypothetical protein
MSLLQQLVCVHFSEPPNNFQISCTLDGVVFYEESSGFVRWTTDLRSPVSTVSGVDSRNTVKSIQHFYMNDRESAPVISPSTPYECTQTTFCHCDSVCSGDSDDSGVNGDGAIGH